jgi:acetoacetyl-CoA synthetase
MVDPERTRAPAKLWEPSSETVDGARLTAFIGWLRETRGLQIDGYEELWRWSVGDLGSFWSAIWEFFDVQADGSPAVALASERMPGAEWFPGTSLNYAEHLLTGGAADDEVAILYASELRDLGELTWGELRRQVGAVAEGLRRRGIGRGDRVVAYMPNCPEVIVAFLATASIGAIWSSCSPDFGVSSVIDRFAQIEPRVLFAVDGYRYGGKDFHRLATVAALREAMPTLEHTVLLPYLDQDAEIADLAEATGWGALLAEGAGVEPRFERVPFGHPLWVLYSSGTTGLPKAIVQSQGGILLEHLKTLNLQVDTRPGDRLFWFTTTGWMMWNFLVSGLMSPAAIVLFDGNPGYPDLGTIWDLAERAGISILGTSAAYFSACMKAGIEPGAGRDLSRLRAIGSTGSPLSSDGFDWIYEHVGADTWLFSISGGTDVCAPLVCGSPLLPVYRGEIQARALGVAVEAWNDEGEAVVGEVGELMVGRPMPSMPIYLWGDEDGSRYRESYFAMIPGVWRHGDWIEITDRGTAIIYGRSDSTINRGGIRMGTSEIYRAVLSLEEITDALVVDVPKPGTDGWMALFVVLREGVDLDDALIAEIATRVRTSASPRHVPDSVFEVAEVPRTLTGKVLEVPVKRILMGTPIEKALSRDSLSNPAALDYFVEMAKTLDPLIHEAKDKDS